MTMHKEEEEASSSSASNDQQMDVDESLTAKSAHRSNILNSVAGSDAFFRSQQRGEKDLSFDEKRDIADDLLTKNCTLFLQRYWKFIDVCDLPFFEDIQKDYEVNFYLQEIQKSYDEKKNKARLQNRRYDALQKMVKEGTYFSNREMRERNPYLYEQLVGKYMSEADRAEERSKNEPNASFSEFLMDRIGRNFVDDLMRRQQDEEEGAVEEEDDDEEEEESELEDEENIGNACLPEIEKRMLVAEFTNIMYESFLSGNDKNFDYSSVDNNEEYDSVKEREVDEEEKYFDAD